MKGLLYLYIYPQITDNVRKIAFVLFKNKLGR